MKPLENFIQGGLKHQFLGMGVALMRRCSTPSWGPLIPHHIRPFNKNILNEGLAQESPSLGISFLNAVIHTVIVQFQRVNELFGPHSKKVKLIFFFLPRIYINLELERRIISYIHCQHQGIISPQTSCELFWYIWHKLPHCRPSPFGKLLATMQWLLFPLFLSKVVVS